MIAPLRTRHPTRSALLPRPAAAPERHARASPLVVDGRMLFSSGIGRYLREILQRAPARGAPFEVLCNAPEQLEWLRAHVPTARGRRCRADLYSFREQFLAWHLPRAATYWVPHYNVPWFFRCRLIATVHDLAPLALPDLFGGRLRRWAAQIYFKGIRLRTRHIITVSHFTCRQLLHRRLAAPERIAVIPNGVSPFWFEDVPGAVRSRRLLCVGNLKPHKNLARLIAAVALARRSHPLELDIVGRVDGFRTGLTDDLLAQFRATPWLRLIGEISDEELRRRYHEADALVLPSLYEGFGLPILEAMAAGCPVLCSNTGALAEVSGPLTAEGGAVDRFDPGTVEDIAAALLRQVKMSPAERKRRQAEGRTIAASYSWDRTAASTWAVLTSHHQL